MERVPLLQANYSDLSNTTSNDSKDVALTEFRRLCLDSFCCEYLDLESQVKLSSNK